MLRKLHGWLWWTKNSPSLAQQGQGTSTAEAIAAISLAAGQMPTADDLQDGLSEALKKKDREKMEKKASRRRVRGGAPAASSSRQTPAPLTQAKLNPTVNPAER